MATTATNRDEETSRAGLVVLRWRRYEIENYLLQPEAIKRFANFPLVEKSVEEAFWRQVPRGTDLFGDHVSLVRVKASDEFLVPLLAPTPKRDLYLLAAAMRPDEIHPEVVGKAGSGGNTACGIGCCSSRTNCPLSVSDYPMRSGSEGTKTAPVSPLTGC